MNLYTMTKEEMLRFTSTLTTLVPAEFTQADIDKIDAFVKSDGCTGVPDFYRNDCVIHDFWYRTHKNFDGSPITQDEADVGLRTLIQRHSWMGRFSPMAWWRWLALKEFFGRKAWRANEEPPLVS